MQTTFPFFFALRTEKNSRNALNYPISIHFFNPTLTNWPLDTLLLCLPVMSLMFWITNYSVRKPSWPSSNTTSYTIIITPPENWRGYPNISQNDAMFEAGDTSSKAHHFVRYPAVSFRGVFWVFASVGFSGWKLWPGAWSLGNLCTHDDLRLFGPEKKKRRRKRWDGWFWTVKTQQPLMTVVYMWPIFVGSFFGGVTEKQNVCPEKMLLYFQTQVKKGAWEISATPYPLHVMSTVKHLPKTNKTVVLKGCD